VNHFRRQIQEKVKGKSKINWKYANFESNENMAKVGYCKGRKERIGKKEEIVCQKESVLPPIFHLQDLIDFCHCPHYLRVMHSGLRISRPKAFPHPFLGQNDDDYYFDLPVHRWHPHFGPTAYIPFGRMRRGESERQNGEWLM
jgi:hypothetical protein